MHVKEITMKTGQDGVALIKHFEACVLKAYPDPATGGKPYTVGIGHTGPEVQLGETITQAEAEALLYSDLERFEKGVDSLVQREIAQHQFDALVSLAFNIGLGNLKTSTLLKKLNAFDDIGAQVQFLAWNRAAGKVMRGLQRRRKAEALVFSGILADMAIREAIEAYP